MVGAQSDEAFNREPDELTAGSIVAILLGRLDYFRLLGYVRCGELVIPHILLCERSSTLWALCGGIDDILVHSREVKITRG